MAGTGISHRVYRRSLRVVSAVALSAAGLIFVQAQPAAAAVTGVTAVNQSLPEGSSKLMNVGHFAGAGPAANYTATVTWGDSTTSAGTVSDSGGGTFVVLATHTYVDEGGYILSFSIHDSSDASNTASTLAVTTVSDADTLGATGAGFPGTEGTSTGSVTVATFTSTYAANPAADFVASINWGDGSPTTTGSVTGSGGSYTVTGVHTYADEGTFTTSVTIADVGIGAPILTHGTATISESDVLTAQPSPTFLVNEGGSTGNFQVASFSDTYGGNAGADFLATIDWGDGLENFGVPVQGGAGLPLTVTGSHTYIDECSCSIVTTIQDAAPGTASATATTHMIVGESDNVILGATPINATEGTAFSGKVGTFATSYLTGSSRAADFSATINWGDGVTTPVTLTWTGDSGGYGNYTITGTHTYGDECSCAFTLTVADKSPGTRSATASGPANVAEGDAFTPAGDNGTVAAGASFSGQVAHFTDTYAGNAAGDFIGSIDWGDSTTSAGTVGGGGASPYTVSGSHTYATPGSYTVTSTLRDGVFAATATSTMTVTAASTATALGQSSASTEHGQPVTFTATVSTTGAGAPTGAVQFKDGGANLGAPVTLAANGPNSSHASLTTSSLSLGSHSITAVYTSSNLSLFQSSTSSAVTHTVTTAATSTVVTQSAASTSWHHSVTLHATVSTAGSGPPTGSVQFKDGGANLGAPVAVAASGPNSSVASLSTSLLSVGSHSISAVFTSSNLSLFLNSTSAAITHVVTAFSPCTRTVTGNVASVTVAAGEMVCLSSANVAGNVTVNAGGGLWVQGGTIGGDTTASSPSQFKMCAATTQGSVTVSNSTGSVLIGDNANDDLYGCSGNSIGTDLMVSGNQASTEIGGNTIGRNASMTGVTGLGPSPDDTAPEIEANTFRGALDCSSNAPAPTNDGAPNRISQRGTGQCASL